MSNSNGYIKAPVNIAADLGYVLGTGSGDLGYNIVNGNINRWAMFKPVRSSAKNSVSRNTLEMLGFGNTLPYATSVQGLLNLYDGNWNGWNYLRPRGAGSSEWYRAFDFCKIASGGVASTSDPGYNHNAPNPFGRFSLSPTTVAAAQGQIQFENGRTIPSGSYPEYNIAIADFNAYSAAALKMQYYGVLLVPPSTSYAYKLLGSTSTIGTTRGQEQMSCIATLTASAYVTGEWTAYPVLSNIAFPDTFINITYANRNATLADSRRLFPLAQSVPTTFVVIEDYIVINLTARALTPLSSTSYDVQWSLTVYNYHEYAITLTECSVRFRLSGKSYADTMQAGEVEVYVPDSGRTITVPAASGTTPGTYQYPSGGLQTTQTLTNWNLSQVIFGGKYNNQLKTGYREFIAPIQPT